MRSDLRVRSHLIWNIASMHTQLVREGIAEHRVLVMLKRINRVLTL